MLVETASICCPENNNNNGSTTPKSTGSATSSGPKAGGHNWSRRSLRCSSAGAMATSHLNNLDVDFFRPAPPTTLFDYGAVKFAVTDRPRAGQIAAYAEQLVEIGVKVVVRVCEPTYEAEDELSRRGIRLIDWPWTDGQPPPKEVMDKFLALCKSVFCESNGDARIAVHCVSGLGRAPVLVAVALIEAGLPRTNAISLIRTRRRGALNARQVDFLVNYEPTGELRKALRNVPHHVAAISNTNSSGHGPVQNACCIM